MLVSTLPRGDMTRRISPLLERAICAEYKEGNSILKIAEKHDICTATAYNVLVRNNVEIRDPANVARKYTLNERYFDEIDSEDKAYFLGLLYADGYNNRKKREVVLQLLLDDKLILDKFRNCLSTNKPLGKIYDKKYSDMWRLVINSEKISRRLEELGCGNNKSFILEYPAWMPKKLHRHFIRGYFDGDGCIAFTVIDNHYRTQQWTFIGTRNFCEFAGNIIHDETGIEPKIHDKKKVGLSEVCVYGRLRLLKVCEWIYKDANYYLPRKHERYIELRDKAKGIEHNYCTMKGCNKRAHGHGLCHKHYNDIYNEIRRKSFNGTIEEYLEKKKKYNDCSLAEFINSH